MTCRSQLIAVFTKDGAELHHGHSLEYSELKVPSEVSVLVALESSRRVDMCPSLKNIILLSFDGIRT